MSFWKNRTLNVVVCSVALFACGGDDDGGSGPPPEDPLVVAATPTASGDAQSGPVGEPLADPLRVVITKASEPQSGVSVAWATTGGGSLDPTTSVTGDDGVATSSWTLGSTAGAQSATATVTDADGSPVTFTATAVDDQPPPPPADITVQVLGPGGGNRFEPADVTIQAGQTVEWVWPQGSLQHNVVPDDAQPASSGGLASGPHTYRFTFDTPGTYNYHCANHGQEGGVGMAGTVTVNP